MRTYIALLRAVNVLGHNRIRMVDLAGMFGDLGFGNITTYLQSGNVIFTGNEVETERLARELAENIENNFGSKVPVIVLTLERLRNIRENNPLVNDADKDPAFMHVTILSEIRRDYGLDNIQARKQAGEEIIFSADVVYLYCPWGYGRTKLTNNLIEKQFKVVATTRNWKTVNELLRISQQTERLL